MKAHDDMAVFLYSEQGDPVASWDTWDDFVEALKLGEVQPQMGQSLHLMTRAEYAAELQFLIGVCH